MARILRIVTVALSALLALALVGAGVVLIIGRALDPIAAGALGVAALAVVEIGVALARRMRIRSAVRGGQRDRVVALIAIALATFGVAIVTVPSSHPNAASVVIGATGVVALLTLVGARLRAIMVPASVGES